jgi:hypothetical protein
MIIRLAGIGVAAAWSVLFAAAPAVAQTDQKIVMTCSNQFPGHTTITVDLAARSVVKESFLPGPAGGALIPFPAVQGTITEISESRIVWSEEAGPNNVANVNTLNRYTGDLVSSGTYGNSSTSCHRQQREF